MSDSIFRNANIILCFPIILVPLLKGEELEASTIFAALSLIDMLSLNSVRFLNYGIHVASECLSLFRRAQTTLLLEEKVNERSEEIEPNYFDRVVRVRRLSSSYSPRRKESKKLKRT